MVEHGRPWSSPRRRTLSRGSDVDDKFAAVNDFYIELRLNVPTAGCKVEQSTAYSTATCRNTARTTTLRRPPRDQVQKRGMQENGASSARVAASSSASVARSHHPMTPGRAGSHRVKFETPSKIPPSSFSKTSRDRSDQLGQICLFNQVGLIIWVVAQVSAPSEEELASAASPFGACLICLSSSGDLCPPSLACASGRLRDQVRPSSLAMAQVLSSRLSCTTVRDGFPFSTASRPTCVKKLPVAALPPC